MKKSRFISKVILIILLMAILIIISLSFFNSTVAEAAWDYVRENEATLEDVKAVAPVGKYKYVFTHALFSDWDNLNCIRRGAVLDCHTLKTEKEGHLHQLTTYVEINGYNAKFYAGEAHSSLPEGTLIHESNCEENNIMAAILSEGSGWGTDASVALMTGGKRQFILYYFWDTWIDASVGTDVEYVPTGDGWYESMLLQNGKYLELTHSRGVNKKMTIEKNNAWRFGPSILNQYIECANENLYSVTLYHFTDRPNDGTAHQHVILSERHETYFDELSVTKEWLDGGNTEKRTDIMIQLYAVKDGVETPVEGRTLVLNEANNWTGKFEELPKNDDNNEMIYYIVKEMNCPEEYNSKMVKNYTGKLGSISANYTITNTLKTKVTVKKKWDDTNDVETFRPQSIQVTLYSNGVSTGKTVTLDENNNWTYTFEELEKYDSKNKEIEYTIKEISVDDYKTEYITTEDPTNGYTTITITNKLSPEYAGYIEITGKVWEDIPDGKANKINNVIDEDESGMGGIKVTLKDKDGNQFDATSTTTTAEDGTYTIKVNYDNSNDVYKLYEDDSIKSKTNTKKKITEIKLSTAYIEFEYDGYVYTTVDDKVTTKKVVNEKGKTVSVKTTQAEQSKAREVWSSRQVIDKKYSTITSTSPLEAEIKKEDNSVIATTKNVIKFNEYKNVKENKVLVNVETRNETQTVKYCNGDGTYIHTNPDGAWNDIIQGSHVCENCPGTGHSVKTFDQIEVKTIKNVNLGLFKREMPDLSIEEDIYQVEIKTNSKTKKYKYDAVGIEASNEDNVVKTQFQNKQTYTYRQPVEPTSIQELTEKYDPTTPKTEILQVYVTYKVQITNEAEKLKAKVNSIVNCFDNRYELVSVKKGTTAVANKNIVKYTDQENESIYGQKAEDYTEIKINNLNLEIKAGKSSTAIYFRYKVSVDAIFDLLNEDATLSNSVEIESYTTYYGSTYYPSKSSVGGQVYAGYDKDSHPGNAGIKLEQVNYTYTYSEEGQTYKKTYENVKVLKSTENLIEYKLTDGTIIKMPQDDTDIAPSFLLHKKDEETPIPESGTLGGIVFEDTDVRGNGERVGNGKYDEGEKTVENVKVELFELQRNDEGDVTQTRLVDSDDTLLDGSYEIKRFEKGKEYYIKFTYGDDTDYLVAPGTTMDGGTTVVNARNYKSTIITDGTIKEILGKDYEDFTDEDKLWYTKHKDGYSVAVDDMEERLNIEGLQYSNYEDVLNMTAYTKPFLIPEEETINISTFDFGIIERPREDLFVEKTITDFKIILANGHPLTQGNPSENSDINYVKVIGFGQTNQAKKELIAEMDAELIQGASLSLQYEITVTNNNEIDYDYGKLEDYKDEFEDTSKLVYDKYITKNEKAKYYYYGDHTGLSEMQATIEYVDYLNGDIGYDYEDNSKWAEIEVSELREEGQELINENVYNTLTDKKYKIFRPSSESVTISRGKTTEALKMLVSKALGSNSDNVYDNYVEIIKIDGKTARTIQEVEDGKQKPKSYTPGNLEPGGSVNEQDDDGNITSITPPTGIITYILYVLVGLAGLIVIAGGITFIKKKVLIK